METLELLVRFAEMENTRHIHLENYLTTFVLEVLLKDKEFMSLMVADKQDDAQWKFAELFTKDAKPVLEKIQAQLKEMNENPSN